MSLNTTSLSASLLSLFRTPPDNITDCADVWGESMEDYSRFVSPLSFNVVTASEALKPLLVFAFTASRDFVSCDTTYIENAFAAFAQVVATGMIGNPHLTLGGTTISSTPPFGKLNFCSLKAQDNFEDAVAAFVERIDNWMRTGIAVVQVAPTPAPPVTVFWE